VAAVQGMETRPCRLASRVTGTRTAVPILSGEHQEIGGGSPPSPGCSDRGPPPVVAGRRKATLPSTPPARRSRATGKGGRPPEGSPRELSRLSRWGASPSAAGRPPRGALDLSIQADGGSPAAISWCSPERMGKGGPGAVTSTQRQRAGLHPGPQPPKPGSLCGTCLRSRPQLRIRGARDPFAPSILPLRGGRDRLDDHLTWTTASEKGMAGWNVYRSENPSGPSAGWNDVALRRSATARPRRLTSTRRYAGRTPVLLPSRRIHQPRIAIDPHVSGKAPAAGLTTPPLPGAGPERSAARPITLPETEASWPAHSRDRPWPPSQAEMQTPVPL